MLPDAWEDSIREFLIAHNPDSVTVGQIARQALSIETPRIGTADQRRIAAARWNGWIGNEASENLKQVTAYGGRSKKVSCYRKP
jgi:hypothetical protein